jgi:multidrug efflux pump subunit AcrA (membrane-fusion protein)
MMPMTRKNRSGWPFALALCGLALALACWMILSLAPVAPAQALDPTLDAAIGVIAQATARARETQAALAAERARLQAEAQATAQAQQAAIAATQAAQAAQATAQVIQAQATAQAVRATSDALALQAQRRDATATADAQIASANATATVQAVLAQATATAIAVQAEADKRANQDAYSARLVSLFLSSFASVAGVLALVTLLLFALAENRRRRTRHAAEMQLLEIESAVKERLQDFRGSNEDGLTGRVVIDVVQSHTTAAGQVGDSEAPPNTVIVHDDDADVTIGKILDAN